MDEIRLAQGEAWYPSLQEGYSEIASAVAVGIRRFSDGYWLDWDDLTFKASGWSTKHQPLAEDDTGLWTYDTGWTIPASNEVYKAQWKVTEGDAYHREGPIIRVNSSYLDVLADLVNGGRLDLLIDDMLTRIPAALVSGRMSSDAVAISGSTDAADKLEASAKTIVLGTVSHDNTVATTTVFYCDDIVEATGEHYKDRIIIFTSGALKDQETDIADYELVSGEGKFTVTALTESPADNVTFNII